MRAARPLPDPGNGPTGPVRSGPAGFVHLGAVSAAGLVIVVRNRARRRHRQRLGAGEVGRGRSRPANTVVMAGRPHDIERMHGATIELRG